MKKYLLHILTCCVAAIMAISCSSDEDNTTLTLDSEYLVAMPGLESYALIITSNGSWTIEKDETVTWVVVSPMKGGSGETKVKITVAENKTGKERATTLRISAGNAVKEFPITQSKEIEVKKLVGNYDMKWKEGLYQDANYNYVGKSMSVEVNIALDSTDANGILLYGVPLLASDPKDLVRMQKPLKGTYDAEAGKLTFALPQDAGIIKRTYEENNIVITEDVKFTYYAADQGASIVAYLDSEKMSFGFEIGIALVGKEPDLEEYYTYLLCDGPLGLIKK